MIGIAALLRTFIRAVRRIARNPEGRGLAVLTGGLVSAGTVFYRLVEDLTWVDAVYFTVITLTTVGYGDIAPSSTAGKIFTTFYVLIGVGLIVTFVSQVAAAILEVRLERTAPEPD